MTLHRFDVIFQNENGLPRDHAVNTWHFDEVAGPPENFDNVRDMLEDFYASIQSRIAGVLYQEEVLVRAYDMTDPEPRAPVYESSFELDTMGSADALPPEVSLCISFQAVNLSGVPQARRRNRKFLPTFTETQNGNGVPTPDVVTAVAAAGAALIAAADAAASWNWVINSPTSGENPVVDNGWVDNAWDTQRRRGIQASSRTPFS